MALKVAAFLLASFLLLSASVSSDSNAEEHLVEASLMGAPAMAPAPANPPPPHIVADAKECVGACKGRCALHSRQNVCNRACFACCAKCKCVPAGTYGNRETCGTCYTGWLTHGNRTKCP